MIGCKILTALLGRLGMVIDIDTKIIAWEGVMLEMPVYTEDSRKVLLGLKNPKGLIPEQLPGYNPWYRRTSQPAATAGRFAASMADLALRAVLQQMPRFPTAMASASPGTLSH